MGFFCIMAGALLVLCGCGDVLVCLLCVCMMHMGVHGGDGVLGWVGVMGGDGVFSRVGGDIRLSIGMMPSFGFGAMHASSICCSVSGLSACRCSLLSRCMCSMSCCSSRACSSRSTSLR